MCTRRSWTIKLHTAFNHRNPFREFSVISAFVGSWRAPKDSPKQNFPIESKLSNMNSWAISNADDQTSPFSEAGAS